MTWQEDLQQLALSHPEGFLILRMEDGQVRATGSIGMQAVMTLLGKLPQAWQDRLMNIVFETMKSRFK